jgi:hypothetical protein
MDKKLLPPSLTIVFDKNMPDIFVDLNIKPDYFVVIF